MIYLDYAATTPISSEAKTALMNTLDEYPGNPSSIHTLGIAAKKKYNSTKKSVARLLGTTHKNLIFTGSGSEASNTIIKGVYAHNKSKTIVTSTIEHAATAESVEYIRSQGGSVKLCAVDSEGFIDLKALETLLNTHDVSLLTLIHSNNEIGTVQEIEKISALTKKTNTLLHLDMVQSVPHMKVPLDHSAIDFASFSAHKFYGPRGTGILYFKNKTLFQSLIHGGHQEFKKRAGTENLANIVATEVALRETIEGLETKERTIQDLGNYFLSSLNETGLDYRLNGPSYHSNARLHNIINIGFKDIQGGQLAFELDQTGICVSQGSACHEDSIKVSHVLKAIDVSEDFIHGSLRFSFSHNESTKDIDYVVKTLERIIDCEL